MTLAKRVQELLVLALTWIPVAALSVFVVEKLDELPGEDFTAYGILAVLVLAAFVATEYILEALKFDTSYEPE
jgi:hypothetical protein